MNNTNYEKNESAMKDNFQEIVSIYFKEFLNKYDNFNSQLKVADTLLKVYQYRYDKLKGKVNNVSDAISINYEEQKDFMLKSEKLDSIDAKLTQVEVKLHLLNKKIDTITEKIDNKLSNK